MIIEVNKTNLYVDIEGSALVPDGPAMRRKPSLILLHGGPGFDHTMFKPAFAQLADIAQIVYVDQRANGRSPSRDRSTWTLAQWGDDVKGLCDVLGITKPIVLGLSWGGIVAQSYAIRHPKHPGGLILSSTTAKMEFGEVFAALERLQGEEARAIAEGYYTNPTLKSHTAYIEKCHPNHGATRRADPDAKARATLRPEVNIHFAKPGGEMGSFDFRKQLRKILCPTLVMAGDKDPITPLPCAETMMEHLNPDIARFDIFHGCGHGVHLDAPERAFRAIRNFIASLTP